MTRRCLPWKPAAAATANGRKRNRAGRPHNLTQPVWMGSSTAHNDKHKSVSTGRNQSRNDFSTRAPLQLLPTANRTPPLVHLAERSVPRVDRNIYLSERGFREKVFAKASGKRSLEAGRSRQLLSAADGACACPGLGGASMILAPTRAV
ncbi:hypothetical protein SKAU_G00047960 [Synaphobranchus kaupii]|uniref:Uncharacterized protein n=1 Tax=Synaphobranchus kaupii TaxID=118154 RepID=A0A9Q1G2V5_SYNKA|nr:hypothetical protein SKAU_G00047960 [Synaphobranchus kaupii]